MKAIFTAIALVGIAGLSAVGATNVEIGLLIPIGIGVGTAVSALIAIFKKKKGEN